MKYLYTLLLLLSFTASQAQNILPRYTGVYYKFAENAIGYRLLNDTSLANGFNPTGDQPLNFRAKDKLLIIAYPTANWAQGVQAGKMCYVRTKSLSPFEKPRPDAEPAIIGVPNSFNPNSSSTTGSSDYHDIRTGPRGGKYYINSNGNKTYIKRR